MVNKERSYYFKSRVDSTVFERVQAHHFKLINNFCVG